MTAEFYIIPQSFAYNGTFTKGELESKIIALAQDFVLIKRYSETNRLYVHPEIYNVLFFDGLPLSALLFPESGKRVLDRDVFNAFQKVVIESAITNNTIEEVLEVLLPLHDEDKCHGLMAFQNVPTIDASFQVVYNVDGWLTFRRHFLGLYPKNPTYFIDECVKYFPGLFIHSRNKQQVGIMLTECPKRLIKHLTALNDKFKQYEDLSLNRTQILTLFSIGEHLDEHASLEGNAARKKDLTFTFTNDQGQTEDVCCEPHLKLCRNDNYPADLTYSTSRRIYFHEGKGSIANGKILVGHIGLHL